MSCREFEMQLARLMAGEVPPSGEAAFLDHAERCTACEKLFAVHLELSGPDLAAAAVDEEDLGGVRRAVLREIRRRTSPVPRRRRPVPGWAGWLVGRPALAAAAAGALALAFLAGWQGARSAPAGGAVLGALDRAAARHTSLRDSVDSPFSYRDVRVRDAGGGRVALEMEVATHVALERPKDDPLVAEVLVQAMLQEQSLGDRLRAVSHTTGLADPRVQDALIAAMLGDPSLPVRLEALARLAGGSPDPRVQDAMLQVVAADAAAQMRLLAIDFLTTHRVPRETLSRAIDALGPAQRFAVLARAEPYLNASLKTEGADR